MKSQIYKNEWYIPKSPKMPFNNLEDTKSENYNIKIDPIHLFGSEFPPIHLSRSSSLCHKNSVPGQKYYHKLTKQEQIINNWEAI